MSWPGTPKSQQSPTINQPSTRYPHSLNENSSMSDVADAMRTVFDGLTVHEQAFANLGASSTSGSSTGSGGTSTTTTSTENVVNNTTIISGGAVNNQTGVTNYLTTQNDNGKAIILGDSSPIGLTLNNSVTLPWYVFVINQDSGAVTVTPQQGTINLDSSLSIVGGSWTTIFFDGANYYAEADGGTSSVVTQIVPGANVTISPPSGTGVVTINSTGGGGGYSLGGMPSVVVESGAGVGASVVLTGLDGSHTVHLQMGSSPVAGNNLFTVTTSAPRGSQYPVFNLAVFPPPFTSLDQIPFVATEASSTSYTIQQGLTPLTAGATYDFFVSFP